MKGKQKVAQELISDLYSRILDGYFGKDDDFDDKIFRDDVEEILDNVKEI